MKDFEEIDVFQAKKIMDEKQATIVDIRLEQDYNIDCIANAILVNDKNIENFVKETDKSKPLICYCYRGFSSKSAASHFIQNGFEQVYSIQGGYEEWQNEFPSA